MFDCANFFIDVGKEVTAQRRNGSVLLHTRNKLLCEHDFHAFEFTAKHSKIYRDISKNNYIFYIENDTVKKL